MAATVMISSGVIAQATGHNLQPLKATKALTNSSSKQHSQLVDQHKSRGIALWQEDFENGSNGWTTNIGTGNVEWTLTAVGNTGGFSPGPLESTTGFPNGSWMTADSDAQGTAGTAEVTTLTSPAITGLDAYPSLSLEFEQSFRQLNDDETTVEISPDNGMTWTAFPVNLNIGGNQSTPGAPVSQLISLNITSALNGGAQNLLIRFRWESFEGFTYAWNVDDISIIEALENDLRLDAVKYNEWFSDQAADFSTLEYSIFPAAQTRPLNFKSNFTNNGSADQTGVTMEVQLTDPMNDILFTASELLQTPFVSGASDSLSIPASNWTTLGRYYADFELLSDSVDQNPSDNVGRIWYEQSDYIFARDTGALDGNIDNLGEAYELGNWFNIATTSLLYGIDVAIDDASIVGTTIYGTIYDGNRDLLEETEEYEITTADLNAAGDANFVTLPFSTPVDVFENEDYLVMGGHFGGPDNVVIGTSGISPAQSSLIYDGALVDWFFVTNTPMVRMNFSPSVGIEDVAFENGLRLSSNMPNPFSDNTTINYELQENTKVTFRVMDMNGKVVFESLEGNKAAGPYTLNFNGTELANGLYNYSIITENSTVSKRMLVTH